MRILESERLTGSLEDIKTFIIFSLYDVLMSLFNSFEYFIFSIKRYKQ